jgi:hypothetical protein
MGRHYAGTMTTPGSGPPSGDPSEPRPAGPATGPDVGPTGEASARAAGRSKSTTHDSPTEVLTGNWPAQAADTIVGVVDKVRDKTTGPIQTAARGLVYGIVAAVLGTMVAVLLIIGAIRLLDAVQPWGNVWLPYLELGLIFLVAGSLIFRRRRLGED